MEVKKPKLGISMAEANKRLEEFSKALREMKAPKEPQYPCVQCGEIMRLCVDGGHAYCKNPKCPNYNLLQIVE